MTPRQAIAELLEDAGAPSGRKTVDEVLARIDGATVEVIQRAVPASGALPDVVAAILESARDARTGRRPVKARPAAVPAAAVTPILDAVPAPDVVAHGLAAARAALAGARRDTTLDPDPDAH